MNILFWVTLGSESSVAGEPKEETSNKTFPFLSSSAISLYIVQLQKISLLPPQKGLMKFPGAMALFQDKKMYKLSLIGRGWGGTLGKNPFDR